MLVYPEFTEGRQSHHSGASSPGDNTQSPWIPGEIATVLLILSIASQDIFFETPRNDASNCNFGSLVINDNTFKF